LLTVVRSRATPTSRTGTETDASMRSFRPLASAYVTAAFTVSAGRFWVNAGARAVTGIFTSAPAAAVPEVFSASSVQPSSGSTSSVNGSARSVGFRTTTANADWRPAANAIAGVPSTPSHSPRRRSVIASTSVPSTESDACTAPTGRSAIVKRSRRTFTWATCWTAATAGVRPGGSAPVIAIA
jgi:hypothetical protein